MEVTLLKNRLEMLLESKNLYDSYIKHMEVTVAKLEENKKIIGMTLNGGLSRGYVDIYSEIDLTLYLENEELTEWNSNISPVANGITVIEGMLYDIKILNINDFEAKEFDEVELWDLSYAKILYDPHNRLKKVFERNKSKTLDISRIERTLFSSWWYFKLATDIWKFRDDFIQGHMMLNKSVEELVKSLYILNEEFIPHEKWFIHMTRTLKILPEDWIRNLNEIMKTGNLDEESLIVRQKAINNVWLSIDKLVKNKFYKDLPVYVMQKYFYELLKFLFENNEIEVVKFKEYYNIEILNNEPFHSIVKIENKRISINQMKLTNLTEEEIYSWHYEILKVFRK